MNVTREQMAEYNRRAFPDVAAFVDDVRRVFGEGVRLVEFTLDRVGPRPTIGSLWANDYGDVLEVRATSDLVVVCDDERVITRDQFPGAYFPVGFV